MTAYSLTYDRFQGDMSIALAALLESEDLTNVTLAIEGKLLKAHQMVLSISSPYFKSILTTNCCKHPVIFMKDVKYHIMKHLLRFMYEGHVEIEDADLPVFIETAQALQIKWLTTDVTENKKRRTQPAQQIRVKKPEVINSRPSNTLKNLLETATPIKWTEPAKKIRKLSIDRCEIVPGTSNDDHFHIEKVEGQYNETNDDEEADSDTELMQPFEKFDDIEDAITPHHVKIEIEEETTEVNTEEEREQYLRLTNPNFQGYEGEPVTAIYMETSKTIHMIINKYHFVKHFKSKYYTSWRCTRCRANNRADRTCKAVINIMLDKQRIFFKNGHNHPPYDHYPNTRIIDNKTFQRTFQRT